VAGNFGVVAVIGETVRVRGYALAGAVVYECADAAAARTAWAALDEDVAVVVLTPAAAHAIGEHEPAGGGTPLTVVLPV
jgi:vacuolar-type H+-ATPase subunit F/Vma7